VALQCGPAGWAMAYHDHAPWPTQNVGWVGHNAFGFTNNWPVCLLIIAVVNNFSGKLVKLVPPDIRS